MNKIVITGATGFVGANLVHRLVQDGYEVHALLRKESHPWRIEDLNSKIQRWVVNLEDENSIDQALKEIQPDTCFHLAANGAYSWQNNSAEIIRTNFLDTVNLADSCIRNHVKVLINTGSSSEYGLKDHAPKETEFVRPNSMYAVTKSAATNYCLYCADHSDLCVSTLRLYSVYGPYEDAGRLIPNLILHGMKKEFPPMTDPLTARDFVYVRDIEDAYILAAEKPEISKGNIYNAGTGTQTSLKAAAEQAKQFFGIESEPVWGSMVSRKWDTNIWVADSTKIRAELGWTPRYSFSDGFQKTAEWFTNQADYFDCYHL